MRKKVLLTHPLFEEVHRKLSSHFDLEIGIEGRQDLLRKIEDKDGLLCFLKDPVDREVIERGKRLKVIANYAVGYDNIDVKAAKERGIIVTNTPDLLTDATADLTWALILAVSRRIVQAHLFTVEGKFKGWDAKLFLGKDLRGKRLGIVGMGRIGRAVARRARGFSMEVVYYSRRRLEPWKEAELCARYLPLDELLETSDVVTLHVPLNEETENLINRERIRKMKKGAILINTARGPVIDEEALIERLREGSLFGAGLDVYRGEPNINPEFFKLENVVLLPHIGSATEETRLAMAHLAADNIIAVLNGREPLTPVWR